MAYTHEHYTILLSFNEQSIYIKLTDTVNFMCYEGNFESCDFPKNFSLQEMYTVLQKCFQGEEHYSFIVQSLSGNLKLFFKALIGGFVNVGFSIFVKEKILSNDGQLTINFNRLEQKQAYEVQQLAKRCETLDNRCNSLEKALQKQSEDFYRILDRLDVLIFPTNKITCQSQFPRAMPKISSETLEINCQEFSHVRFENLRTFYKLKKLVIRQFFSVYSDLTYVANNTVTDLELVCEGHSTFTSLKGFTNFPSLTSLTVVSAPGLANVVAMLKSAPHKINSFKFQGCTSVNVVEMQTYCQENKIFVAFS
jgi:hypothetical protein